VAEPKSGSATQLEPLEPWFQASGLPEYPLPAQLSELYGGPFGLPTPVLYANFVESLDGVAVVGPSSGSKLSGNSQADRFVMGLLRACADTILIGSGTLLGSPGHIWTAEHVFPPAASAFAELRRRLGRAERPTLAVVTGSGEIDLDHAGLRRGGLLLTSATGQRRLGSPRGFEVISLGRGPKLDPSRIVGALREVGNQALLTEGGPQLLAQLVHSGQLDQLFLTISPLLAGRRRGGRRPSFVDGADLLEGERSPWLSLLSARRHRSHLFLRYRLERTTSAAESDTPPGSI
jgi:riboflavin biosynthesis pyrimidine reductase